MNDKGELEKVETTVQAPGRRKFVKTAGQVAVTAPAVALLLGATTNQALAAAGYLGGHGTGTGDVGIAADDPNHNEDIDFCHGTGLTADDHTGTCGP